MIPADLHVCNDSIDVFVMAAYKLCALETRITTDAAMQLHVWDAMGCGPLLFGMFSACGQRGEFLRRFLFYERHNGPILLTMARCLATCKTYFSLPKPASTLTYVLQSLIDELDLRG